MPTTPTDTRNYRQKRSMNDQCSLWKSTVDPTAAADGFIKGAGVPVEIYDVVHFRLDQTDYATQTSEVGRRFTSNLETNDYAEFTASISVLAKDAWFFRLDTPGHPQNGQWWAFQSDAMVVPSRGNRKANYAEYRVKACTDPTLVPNNTDV